MEEIKLKCEEKFEDLPFNCVESTINKLEKKVVRDWLFNENKRVDGRKMDEIRPLSCEVNFLPVVHGCGLFSRGLTKTMSVVTLGSLSEEQKLDGLTSKTSKRYIHHYNFPSYSVGETRPNRAPGRREIGHGALAEKALRAVIPSVEEFPYTIRVVSETLSSNGSTSQASICSSTLALMDAGVPIKAPVAGIAMGLIALGGLGIGLLSISGIALGLILAIGGISLGTISIGGLSFGVFAIGGCAIGIYAIGGGAFAKNIAMGGYASGHIAIGEQVNGAYKFIVENGVKTFTSEEVKNTILKEFPKTLKIIVSIFSNI